jgi:hypothetical protein
MQNNSEQGSEKSSEALRLRIRFDFKGRARGRRLFAGGKSAALVAEDMREQKVSYLRNVPMQGIEILDIDLSYEAYTVHDEEEKDQVAYAPAIVTLSATSVDDVVKFVVREEFRKLEILEPDFARLSRISIERLLFRVNEEFMEYRSSVERRLENWK